MSLNWLEIDRIIEELDLEGSQLQKVRAIDFETFYFTFYKPGNPINVLICLNENYRMHRVSTKVNFLKESHNLVEYFKSNIVNGIVNKCEHVDKNRIIKLEIKSCELTFNIFVRLWGGFSNIIITNKDMTILHLHKKSSKKLEQPGLKLTLPPKRQTIKKYVLDSYTESSYNSYIENLYLNKISSDKISKDEETLELLKIKRVKELKRQVKFLNKKIEDYSKGDDYKLFAELILSNIHNILPGDKLLIADNYLDGSKVSIPLDPKMKAHENSDIYFKKFKKAESGLIITITRRDELLLEISKLETGEILPKLKDVKQNTKSEITTGLRYSSNGWDILVGRNAKENDQLLRRYVKGNDMWLHIRDYPGGYVFIKSKKGKSIPLEILKDAGILALYYSKGKKNEKADIYYTQVKYLKRVKKGKLGQVIPTKSKNLYVTLDKDRLNRLKA